MQSKPILLILAGAARVHKMTLRVDLSVCMRQARARARVPVRERVCGYRQEEVLGLLRANGHFQHVIPSTQLDV